MMKISYGHPYFSKKYLINISMEKSLMNLFKVITTGKEDKKKIGQDCLIYGE